MTEAVGALISGALLLALAGSLPGTCMRVIVQLYPRSDVRRRELQAELYAVPPKFTSRMFWVGQQFEVAVFEGLIRGRWIAVSRWLAARAIGRVFRSQAIHAHLQDFVDDDGFPISGLWWAMRECASGARQRWALESGVRMHREYPETFWIPDQDEKAEVAPGDHVKLLFRTTDDWGERVWVKVTDRIEHRMTGVLDNVPVGIARFAGRRRDLLRDGSRHRRSIVRLQELDDRPTRHRRLTGHYGRIGASAEARGPAQNGDFVRPG